MTKKPFQGTGTAMITPFKDDGSLDEKALRRFVDFQIDGGVDMLLPCGTTGEGATLENDETDRVVQIVIEQSRGRVVDLEDRRVLCNCRETDGREVEQEVVLRRR